MHILFVEFKALAIVFLKEDVFSSYTMCCICIESVSHSVVSNSLQPHGLWSARFLCPWNSPGKNTGVYGHSPLKEIFPTQGLNPGLPLCRQILYQLSHLFQNMINAYQVYCIDGRLSKVYVFII